MNQLLAEARGGKSGKLIYIMIECFHDGETERERERMRVRQRQKGKEEERETERERERERGSERDLVRGKDYALVIECERETGRERWSDREVGRKFIMYRCLRR